MERLSVDMPICLLSDWLISHLAAVTTNLLQLPPQGKKSGERGGGLLSRRSTIFIFLNYLYTCIFPQKMRTQGLIIAV